MTVKSAIGSGRLPQQGEMGSMLPLFAALAFTALVVVALVADIAMLQVAYRSTASRADRIAEGAASQIDEGWLRAHGAIRLDTGAARVRAEELAGAEGIGPEAIDLEVSIDRLCVTIVQPHMPFALPAVVGSSVSVEVRACADPDTG